VKRFLIEKRDCEYIFHLQGWGFSCLLEDFQEEKYRLQEFRTSEKVMESIQKFLGSTINGDFPG